MNIQTVLLDRDGTLNIDHNYSTDPEKIALISGTIDGLVRLQNAGVKFFVVTNQSIVGAGMCSLQSYKACEDKLCALLMAGGIPIEKTYVCLHARDEKCHCRKPNIGLWEQLKKENPSVRAETAVMVGDKDSDMQFGKNIGVKTARIISHMYPMTEKADHTVADMNELADILLAS